MNINNGIRLLEAHREIIGLFDEQHRKYAEKISKSTDDTETIHIANRLKSLADVRQTMNDNIQNAVKSALSNNDKSGEQKHLIKVYDEIFNTNLEKETK